MGGVSGTSRVMGALLVALVLAGACTSDDPGSKPPAAGSQPPEEDPLRRPPKAKPKSVKSALDPKTIRRCLYRERVDPASYQGAYFSVNDLVADQVETSRDIDFTPGDVQMLDPKAFAGAFEDLQVKVSEREEVVTRSLAWALGVTPQGLSVNRFLKGEGTGLVAGFYDPGDGSIIVERKGKLDSEYIVLAHEFAHAAVDQVFGLPSKDLDGIIDDSGLARGALVEGDASLAELRVISRLFREKDVKKAIAAQVNIKDRFEKDRELVPYLLMDSVLFPYQWGTAFACSVFREEGWAGLNRALRRPPTTTAQILFADRFLSGEGARNPQALGNPGKEWKKQQAGDFGAAHLKSMFEAPGDDEESAMSKVLGRVASWAGGRYEVWTKKKQGRQYTVGVSFVEHKDHRGVLCASLNKWYETAFEDAEPELVANGTFAYDGGQDAYISCRGNKVLMGISGTDGPASAIIGLET